MISIHPPPNGYESVLHSSLISGYSQSPKYIYPEITGSAPSYKNIRQHKTKKPNNDNKKLRQEKDRKGSD